LRWLSNTPRGLVPVQVDDERASSVCTIVSLVIRVFLFPFFSKSFLPFTFADEVKVVNISRLLWPEAIRRGISKSKQRRARRIVFVVAVRYIFSLLQKRFANNKEKRNYFERHFLFCFQ
jgi:hypothetical protein